MTIDDQRRDRGLLLHELRAAGADVSKPSSFCCPFHDDRNPSAGVFIGQDGIFRFKCHACGAGGDLFDVRARRTKQPLGEIVTQAQRGIDTASSSRAPAQRANQNGSRRRFPTADAAIAALNPEAPVQQWEYHDVEGLLVGVVIRWDTGDRKQYRAVSRNGAGWTTKGMSVPRPLYQLVALKSAPQVLVCEGEKSADAARQLGFVATTSPHGAKSASKADLSPLAGKEVVILPDNDEDGELYAADVVAQLAKLTPRPVIQVVRLIDLWPEMPEKGDIFDLLQHRAGDLETLRSDIDSLIEATEPSVLPDVGYLAPNRFQPFPTHMLPKPLATVITRVARAIGCDHSFVALPMLSVLSAAIGNSREIELKPGWREPSILWTAIVGDSGTMKSPALEHALKPVRDRQRSSMSAHAGAVQHFEMALEIFKVASKRSITNEEGPRQRPLPPVLERLLCDDTTVEALAVLLQDQPRGILLARDELSGWIGSFDRYASGKGSDCSKWLEMFGGRPMVVDRKTGSDRTICVGRAAVSIAGGIQPAILRRALTSEHRANGLAARILFAMPPRVPKRWTEESIDEQTERILEDLVERLYSLEPSNDNGGYWQPVTLRLSEEGRQEWVRFYNEHAKEQADLADHDLAAAWAKLEAYAARLALVIHCVRCAIDSPSVTDEEHVDGISISAGVELARWFGGEAQRIYATFNENDAERECRALLEFVERKGGSITPSDLVRGSRAIQTVEQAKAQLNDLVEAGHGEWIQPPQCGKGRPQARRFVLSR